MVCRVLFTTASPHCFLGLCCLQITIAPPTIVSKHQTALFYIVLPPHAVLPSTALPLPPPLAVHAVAGAAPSLVAAAVAAAGADPHQRSVRGMVDGGLPDAGLVAVTALLSAPARAAEGFFKRYSVSVNNML